MEKRSKGDGTGREQQRYRSGLTQCHCRAIPSTARPSRDRALSASHQQWAINGPWTNKHLGDAAAPRRTRPAPSKKACRTPSSQIPGDLPMQMGRDNPAPKHGWTGIQGPAALDRVRQTRCHERPQDPPPRPTTLGGHQFFVRQTRGGLSRDFLSTPASPPRHWLISLRLGDRANARLPMSMKHTDTSCQSKSTRRDAWPATALPKPKGQAAVAGPDK